MSSAQRTTTTPTPMNKETKLLGARRLSCVAARRGPRCRRQRHRSRAPAKIAGQRGWPVQLRRRGWAASRRQDGLTVDLLAPRSASTGPRQASSWCVARPLRSRGRLRGRRIGVAPVLAGWTARPDRLVGEQVGEACRGVPCAPLTIVSPWPAWRSAACFALAGPPVLATCLVPPTVSGSSGSKHVTTNGQKGTYDR